MRHECSQWLLLGFPFLIDISAILPCLASSLFRGRAVAQWSSSYWMCRRSQAQPLPHLQFKVLTLQVTWSTIAQRDPGELHVGWINSADLGGPMFSCSRQALPNFHPCMEMFIHFYHWYYLQVICWLWSALSSYCAFETLTVSSEDSNNSEPNESGLSEEVSDSEDEQRPRTRYNLFIYFLNVYISLFYYTKHSRLLTAPYEVA